MSFREGQMPARHAQLHTDHVIIWGTLHRVLPGRTNVCRACMATLRSCDLVGGPVPCPSRKDKCMQDMHSLACATTCRWYTEPCLSPAPCILLSLWLHPALTLATPCPHPGYTLSPPCIHPVTLSLSQPCPHPAHPMDP
jgi:hypothetical protein